MQRRREHRYEVWESVALTVLGDSGQPCRAATVVDISRSGYRVLSGLDLAVGTEVLITLNSVAIVGTVRHSEAAEEGSYTTGVQINRVISDDQPTLPQTAAESNSSEIAADGPVDTRLRM